MEQGQKLTFIYNIFIMNKRILAIDIGGTNLRGGLVDLNGEITKRKKVYSGADKGISSLMDNLVKFVSGFRESRPLAVSIGIPGIVNFKNGILTQAPNIKDVDNYPLKNELESKLELDIPVQIENDANCAAVGEYWAGAGKGCSSMIMLTIGTGLGGGLIFDGELWRGEDGMGGEIGHIVIDPAGPLCNCGNHGCLETFVSARALDRMVRSNIDLAHEFSGKPYHEVPVALMNKAIKGDTQSLEIWKETGMNLGIGLTTLVNLLNVERIVIGGGISNAWDLFIEHARTELFRRGLRAPVERAQILKGELGDDAGILGASYLGFRKTGTDPEI